MNNSGQKFEIPQLYTSVLHCEIRLYLIETFEKICERLFWIIPIFCDILIFTYLANFRN